MTNQDYRIMELLMQSNQERTKAVMSRVLSKCYPSKDIIETEHFIYCEGSIEVGLVAHLDTVAEKSRQGAQLYWDREKQIMFCPGYPGFDDKAGVYSIIKILQMGYRPTVCLCCDEEVGGIGASALADHFEHNPPQLKYMIELDRHGHTDMVSYECDNKDFTNYVGSFGFEKAYGSFTDISFLMEAFNLAAMNLSCGYENEHSATEILHVDWMEETIEKVCKMLDCANEAPRFEFIPSPHYWRWANPTVDDKNSCYMCGKALSPEERVPVELDDMTTENFCIDCAASVDVDWCETCGNAFMGHENQKLCFSCENKVMGPYNF